MKHKTQGLINEVRVGIDEGQGEGKGLPKIYSSKAKVQEILKEPLS